MIELDFASEYVGQLFYMILGVLSSVFSVMNHPALTEALGDVSLPLILLSFWFTGALITIFCVAPGGNVAGLAGAISSRNKSPDPHRLTVTRRQKFKDGSIHTVVSDGRSGDIVSEGWLFND